MTRVYRVSATQLCSHQRSHDYAHQTGDYRDKSEEQRDSFKPKQEIALHGLFRGTHIG